PRLRRLWHDPALAIKAGLDFRYAHVRVEQRRSGIRFARQSGEDAEMRGAEHSPLVIKRAAWFGRIIPSLAKQGNYALLAHGLTGTDSLVNFAMEGYPLNRR